MYCTHALYNVRVDGQYTFIQNLQVHVHNTTIRIALLSNFTHIILHVLVV